MTFTDSHAAADALREVANFAASLIGTLELKTAYLESRIAFYLDRITTPQPGFDLAKCIEDDLARIKSDREGFYGRNVTHPH